MANGSASIERTAFEAGPNSLFVGTDEYAERRLTRLIALNEEFERSAREDESRNRTIVNGIDFERTYAFLGLCLGLLPPAAFFLRFVFEGGNFAMLAIGSLVASFAALAGYFSGRTVGRVVRQLQDFSWPAMIAVLPFVGLLWGIVAGAAGGVFAFLFGAIPGAVIGGVVGFAALPVFAAIHRSVRVGEMIENRVLIPTAIGVAGAIAAAFLSPYV